MHPVKGKVLVLNSFYEELEQVFYHFSKHHTKNLLGDLNTKLRRETIFKRTRWN